MTEYSAIGESSPYYEDDDIGVEKDERKFTWHGLFFIGVIETPTKNDWIDWDNSRLASVRLENYDTEMLFNSWTGDWSDEPTLAEAVRRACSGHEIDNETERLDLEEY